MNIFVVNSKKRNNEYENNSILSRNKKASFAIDTVKEKSIKKIKFNHQSILKESKISPSNNINNVNSVSNDDISVINNKLNNETISKSQRQFLSSKSLININKISNNKGNYQTTYIKTNFKANTNKYFNDASTYLSIKNNPNINQKEYLGPRVDEEKSIIIPYSYIGPTKLLNTKALNKYLENKNKKEEIIKKKLSNGIASMFINNHKDKRSNSFSTNNSLKNNDEYINVLNLTFNNNENNIINDSSKEKLDLLSESLLKEFNISNNIDDKKTINMKELFSNSYLNKPKNNEIKSNSNKSNYNNKIFQYKPEFKHIKVSQVKYIYNLIEKRVIKNQENENKDIIKDVNGFIKRKETSLITKPLNQTTFYQKKILEKIKQERAQSASLSKRITSAMNINYDRKNYNKKNIPTYISNIKEYNPNLLLMNSSQLFKDKKQLIEIIENNKPSIEQYGQNYYWLMSLRNQQVKDNNKKHSNHSSNYNDISNIQHDLGFKERDISTLFFGRKYENRKKDDKELKINKSSIVYKNENREINKNNNNIDFRVESNKDEFSKIQKLIFNNRNSNISKKKQSMKQIVNDKDKVKYKTNNKNSFLKLNNKKKEVKYINISERNNIWNQYDVKLSKINERNKELLFKPINLIDNNSINDRNNSNNKEFAKINQKRILNMTWCKKNCYLRNKLKEYGLDINQYMKQISGLKLDGDNLLLNEKRNVLSENSNNINSISDKNNKNIHFSYILRDNIDKIKFDDKKEIIYKENKDSSYNSVISSNL